MVNCNLKVLKIKTSFELCKKLGEFMNGKFENIFMLETGSLMQTCGDPWNIFTASWVFGRELLPFFYTIEQFQIVRHFCHPDVFAQIQFQIKIQIK